MPFSDKVDVFNITNCQNESEYLYFTEYSDMHDGTYVFSIVRYNITDHTHTKIISLKDNINLYPDNKQIKIFILDESNLIIQRALPRISKNGILKEFFDYSLILFNFDKNKQIFIKDENLVKIEGKKVYINDVELEEQAKDAQEAEAQAAKLEASLEEMEESAKAMAEGTSVEVEATAHSEAEETNE